MNNSDLEKILDAFSEHLRFRGRARLTVDGYLADIRRFAGWWVNHYSRLFKLENVSADDLSVYLEQEQGKLPATVNRWLAALSELFAWGEKTGVCQHNPAAEIRRLLVEQGAPIYLTPAEQHDLEKSIKRRFKQAENTASITRIREAAIVLLLLSTGLRLTEVLGLELDDVNLHESHGTIQVQGSRPRRIPLDELACRALHVWIAVRAKDPSAYLWAGDGQIPSPRSLQRACKRLADQAGLDPTCLNPQVLRHTFARNLIDRGESLRVVARLMGYRSAKSVLRYQAFSLQGESPGLYDSPD